jgi:hypothetical protein
MTDTTNPQADDRAALRDRIAEALMRWAERNNDPKYAPIRRPDTVTANAYGRAAAVLAVLPAPADRAAILRDAADAYDAIISKSTGKEADPRYWQGVHDVAVGLRALADAVPVSGPGGAADETQASCPGVETQPNRCSCDCEGCRHNCAAHQPAVEPAPPVEHCIHDRTVHRTHHKQPVTGCP